MKRRAFITFLGGAAVAWPLAARAPQQPPKAARVGYLSAASAPDANIESFRQGMRGIGYVEGHNFVIEARYAERDYSSAGEPSELRVTREAARNLGLEI